MVRRQTPPLPTAAIRGRPLPNRKLSLYFFLSPFFLLLFLYLFFFGSPFEVPLPSISRPIHTPQSNVKHFQAFSLHCVDCLCSSLNDSSISLRLLHSAHQTHAPYRPPTANILSIHPPHRESQPMTSYHDEKGGFLSAPPIGTELHAHTKRYV